MVTEADINNIAYGIDRGDQHGIDGINYGSGLPFLDAIVKSYKETFGRLPTVNEVSLAAPAFQASGTSGNAYVAQLYQSQNPNEAAKKGASNQYGSVDQLFQSKLGRGATQEEKDHFGTLLASKQYDLYDIGDMLDNLPENVRKQDEDFRKGLTDTLQKQDQQYYNEKVLPGIRQSFLQSGGTLDPNDSTYAAALANAAKEQNTTREGFLSNLTSSQYEGNKNRAYSDYVNNFNYSRGRTDSAADRNTQRMYDYENFNMQKQAYDAYLSRYGKRSQGQGIGQMAGGIIGGAAGAYFGGPQGASAGYQMGAGLGGGVGSFF
jgi:hypothetical protein